MDWGFVAEDADAYQALPSDIERHIRDDAVLIHSRSGDAWSNPHARGRGAYRALVRARWDASQAMGAPALVTQAKAASRPILERLGFRTAGSIVVLVDFVAGR